MRIIKEGNRGIRQLTDLRDELITTKQRLLRGEDIKQRFSMLGNLSKLTRTLWDNAEITGPLWPRQYDVDLAKARKAHPNKERSWELANDPDLIQAHIDYLNKILKIMH